jgi:hypothetical protein
MSRWHRWQRASCIQAHRPAGLTRGLRRTFHKAPRSSERYSASPQSIDLQRLPNACMPQMSTMPRHLPAADAWRGAGCAGMNANRHLALFLSQCLQRKGGVRTHHVRKGDGGEQAAAERFEADEQYQRAPPGLRLQPLDLDARDGQPAHLRHLHATPGTTAHMGYWGAVIAHQRPTRGNREHGASMCGVTATQRPLTASMAEAQATARSKTLCPPPPPPAPPPWAAARCCWLCDQHGQALGRGVDTIAGTARQCRCPRSQWPTPHAAHD